MKGSKQSSGVSKPGSTGSRAVVSKVAYNVAKATINGGDTGGFGSEDKTGTLGSGTTNSYGMSVRIVEPDNDAGRMTREMEDEIMGDQRSKHNQKSNAMEKNLHQMIDVLNSRLKTLGDVAKIRMKLCEDDINKDSQNTSKQAPRIGDDMDESIPRSLRDAKSATSNATSGTISGSHQKDNLVSSDNVFIDPYHLVLRTRAPTEAAKKLEANLEQSFGNLNVREMKNKKTKTQSDKSKRSEQLKNDKKRENRQRIEKKLQLVMENFVTRSVMDTDLVFELPDHMIELPEWPVTVKWCKEDPRSQRHDNADGEFNPDLLLRYSMERITLPSGRGVFAWLLRQPVIQRYFVTLFWLIKVKFFESDAEDREAYLLRLLSLDYRQIVELMANRTHAEHEKDFVYKFLPFLLTNGVFFGFYYVFPGSRHIYTKGFKKTIYMQIVQIMHGLQVCPVTVKVSWAKLFPEDFHDDGGEENEDGGELFPVQIAFKQPRIRQAAILPAVALDSPSFSTKSSFVSETEGDEGEEEDAEGTPKSLKKKGGLLSDDHEGSSSSLIRRAASAVGAKRSDTESLDKPNSAPTGGGSVDGSQSLATHSLSRSTTTFNQKSIVELRADELLGDKRLHRPFMQTFLHPLPERPANLRGHIKRQNNIEKINASDISPAMSLFLASRSEAQGIFDHPYSQTLRRTVPVQWCPAGGSDTHRRRQVNHELHGEISNKLLQSEDEYHDITYGFHRKKLKALRGLDKSLTKVLSSGSTNISRMSLDLIRRQRTNRGANSPRDAPAPTIEEVDMAEMAQLAQYDDDEIDRFIAEL